MSRKKKTELRIFKLRSGEEIIAKVAGKTKDKIKLQRPMRIMNNIQSDPYTGAKRQVIYFSDWLGSTSEIIADIPLDFIVVELQPDPDIVCLYDRQTEADDRGAALPLPPSSTAPAELPLFDEDEMLELSDDVDKKLEELLKRMAQEDAPPQPTDYKNPLQSVFDQLSPVFPPSFPPSFPPRVEGIVFSVSIPKDILASGVESGFLDYLKDCISDFTSTDFLEQMMNEEEEEEEDEEVEDKPKRAKRQKREKTSKDDWKEPADEHKAKPEYGNTSGDWSPFLKDYLPEQEPPKNTDKG